MGEKHWAESEERSAMLDAQDEAKQWREVAQELAEALRTFQAMAAPGSPRRKRVDPVLARFDALNTEEKR